MKSIMNWVCRLFGGSKPNPEPVVLVPDPPTSSLPSAGEVMKRLNRLEAGIEELLSRKNPATPAISSSPVDAIDPATDQISLQVAQQLDAKMMWKPKPDQIDHIHQFFAEAIKPGGRVTAADIYIAYLCENRNLEQQPHLNTFSKYLRAWVREHHKNATIKRNLARKFLPGYVKGYGGISLKFKYLKAIPTQEMLDLVTRGDRPDILKVPPHLKEFAEECLFVEMGSATMVASLYDAYRQHQAQQNRPQISFAIFGRHVAVLMRSGKMRKVKPIIISNDIFAYQNLALRDLPSASTQTTPSALPYLPGEIVRYHSPNGESAAMIIDTIPDNTYRIVQKFGKEVLVPSRAISKLEGSTIPSIVFCFQATGIKHGWGIMNKHRLNPFSVHHTYPMPNGTHWVEVSTKHDMSRYPSAVKARIMRRNKDTGVLEVLNAHLQWVVASSPQPTPGGEIRIVPSIFFH